MPPPRLLVQLLVPLFLLSWSSEWWLVRLVEGGQSRYHQNPLGGNAGTSSPICYGHWQSVGPFHVSSTYPGINDLTDPEDIGSASDLWLSGSTAYLGSVNGGVWRTRNISGSEAYGGPHWEPLTDHMPCSSISTITGSKDDSNIIVAGCGFPSNADGRGSEPLGVMISKDGGDTWSMTNFPRGYWISDLIVEGTSSTGARIMVSAKQGIRVQDRFGNMTDPYGIGNSTSGGIWLSIDSGFTFSQQYSTTVGNVNAPYTSVSRIVQDPRSGSVNTFYVSLLVHPNQPMDPLPNTILIKSINAGMGWTPWLTPDFTEQCPDHDQIENSQLTIVGATIYAGFYLTQSNSTATGVDSSCYAFFKSINGDAFTSVTGVPTSDSLGSLGSSGASHLTILAAPTAPDILFVAGSGHAVYCVDTTTNTWTLISTVPGLDPTTHATRSGTAPHADANRFEWNEVTGELLLTNGGSVYRRTNPLLSPDEGDWFSLSGDLSITEIYSMSLEKRSGCILLASQDNSFMISQFDGSEADSGMWNFVSRAGGRTTGNNHWYGGTFFGGDQNLGNLFRVRPLGNVDGAGVNWSIFRWTNKDLNSNCSLGDSRCLHSSFSLIDSLDFGLYLLTCTGTTIDSSASPSTSSSPTVCYVLEWEPTYQTVTTLEFNSTTFEEMGIELAGSFDVFVDGSIWKGNNWVDNLVFAAGVGYSWSRDVPCPNTACISILDQCLPDGCNPNNFINRQPPWSNTGKPLKLVARNPVNYFINVVVDGIGHIYLTADFGRSYIDLNLPQHSNLLSISGHTSIDTFSTSAVYFVPDYSPWFAPMLVSVGNGIFISSDDPTTHTYLTFYPFGVNLPKVVVTSFAYFQQTDTLYVSTLGRGIWTLQNLNYRILPHLLTDNSTFQLNSACLQPLYPNVPNAYGYIPPPGRLPNDIGFGPSEVLVSGIPTNLPLNGNFTMTIALADTEALPSTGSFILQPTIITPGGWGYFIPAQITFSFYDGNVAQTVTFYSNSSDGGSVQLTTLLLGDFTYADVEPFTTTFTILGPQPSGWSSISSSSSSTGLDSSSTGLSPCTSSSSSTGAQTTSSSSSSTTSLASSSTSGMDSSSSGLIDASSSSGSTSDSFSSSSISSSSSSTGSSSLDIPSLLPSIRLSFALTLATIPSSSLAMFRSSLMNDLASTCQIDPKRILILTIQDSPIITNTLDVTFTITPRLSNTDSDASTVGQLFLTATSSSSTDSFFSLPIGQYAIVGSSSLTPSPSTAIDQLQQVSFGLNYDINNLPGGNTIKSFSSFILSDVSAACSVEVATPSTRLFMLGLTAGSIQAAFTISPNFTANEPTVEQIIQTFLAAAADPNSRLYSGTTTSATIAGSTSVGIPGSSTTLPSDDPTSNRRMILIGIGIGVSVGLLFCCLILVCYYYRRQRVVSPSNVSRDARNLVPTDDTFSDGDMSEVGPNGHTTAVGGGSFELTEISIPTSNRQPNTRYSELS